MQQVLSCAEMCGVFRTQTDKCLTYGSIYVKLDVELTEFNKHLTETENTC